jgi:hypothetical protein
MSFRARKALLAMKALDQCGIGGKSRAESARKGAKQAPWRNHEGLFSQLIAHEMRMKFLLHFKGVGPFVALDAFRANGDGVGIGAAKLHVAVPRMPIWMTALLCPHRAQGLSLCRISLVATSRRSPASSRPPPRANGTSACTGPHAEQANWQHVIRSPLSRPAAGSLRQQQQPDTSGLRSTARLTVASSKAD